jgi:hypothetical protein
LNLTKQLPAFLSGSLTNQLPSSIQGGDKSFIYQVIKEQKSSFDKFSLGATLFNNIFSKV